MIGISVFKLMDFETLSNQIKCFKKILDENFENKTN